MHKKFVVLVLGVITHAETKSATQTEPLHFAQHAALCNPLKVVCQAILLEVTGDLVVRPFVNKLACASVTTIVSRHVVCFVVIGFVIIRVRRDALSIMTRRLFLGRCR